MVTESFFSIACAGLIAFMFGMALTFGGYRLFLFLLPVWGFVWGFLFGAQTMTALFGEGFLSTVTSWIVGFIVGALFAALSYMFYIVAVAVMAGSLGYSLAVGFLGLLGMDMGLLVWIVGVIAAVAVAAAALFLNVQKWVIIIASAIIGAGAIIGTFVLMFNPSADVLAHPVSLAMSTHPLLGILFLVLAALGGLVQYRSSRTFMIAEYNRWE